MNTSASAIIRMEMNCAPISCNKNTEEQLTQITVLTLMVIGLYSCSGDAIEMAARLRKVR